MRVGTVAVATLVAAVAVALSPATAAAVDQEPKNGCTSPEAYGGSLTSPPFNTPFPEGTTSQVRFQGWFEGESVAPGSHDVAVVETSLDGGETWEPIGQLSDSAPPNSGGGSDMGYSNNGTGQPPTFKLYTFELPIVQTGVRLRFRFDAVDSLFNGFRGFGVDNVTIDTTSGPLNEGFEGQANGWIFDPPGAQGPHVPFWHTVTQPQSNIFIKSPEINPDLITLAAGDNGSLPPPPQPIEGSSFSYAWFGDDAIGTFCGPDYANRFQEPPPDSPTPASSPIAAAQTPPRTVDDLPAPGFATSVNVQELSGQVFVGVPGVAAGAKGARASQKGITFVPLSEARQIPVGSFLDTRRGKLRLQSARDRRGTRQNGDFSQGLFQVLQSRRSRGLTDVVLKGASFSSCRRGGRGKRATGAFAPAAATRRRRFGERPG
jgi:hypothetical protein